MTCGGSFPSERLAPLPAAATAASTASLGTEDASTPSEIQSVRRPPAAITPFCVMTRDLAGPLDNTGRDAPKQDQTRLSGIASRPGDHSQGLGAYEEEGKAGRSLHKTKLCFKILHAPLLEVTNAIWNR